MVVVAVIAITVSYMIRSQLSSYYKRSTIGSESRYWSISEEQRADPSRRSAGNPRTLTTSQSPSQHPRMLDSDTLPTLREVPPATTTSGDVHARAVRDAARRVRAATISPPHFASRDTAHAGRESTFTNA